MIEKEKRSLKIRLGKRLSHDKSRVMEIIKEEIDKTKTTKELPHGSPCVNCQEFDCAGCAFVVGKKVMRNDV